MSAGVERELRAFLASINYPWSIEPGSKHDQVLIAGRPVGVICRKHSRNEKDAKQIIAAVRRAVRALDAAKVAPA